MSCPQSLEGEPELLSSMEDNRLPPESLFKYRSMPLPGAPAEIWRREEVTEGHLYFARPSELNDAFDCRPSWVLDADESDVASYLERVGSRHLADLADRERRQMQLLVQGRIHDVTHWNRSWLESVDRLGVYCLTEDPANPLMWAHYGDGHRGYCLHFTVSGVDWEQFEIPMGVIYHDARPRFSTREWLAGTASTPEFLTRAVLTKHDLWHYEREWRMVRTPLDGGPGRVSCPPHLLTGIIVGSSMSKADEERLRDWTSQRSPALAWYRAVSSPTEYEVEVRRG